MNRIILFLCAILALAAVALLYQLSLTVRYVPYTQHGGILDTRTGAIYNSLEPVNGNPQVAPPLP